MFKNPPQARPALWPAAAAAEARPWTPVAPRRRRGALWRHRTGAPRRRPAGAPPAWRPQAARERRGEGEGEAGVWLKTGKSLQDSELGTFGGIFFILSIIKIIFVGIFKMFEMIKMILVKFSRTAGTQGSWHP